MKRRVDRLLAVLLALVLLTGMLLIPASAVKNPAQLNTIDKSPVILIHGIGQSEVYLYDTADPPKIALNADGNPIQGWPPKVDMKLLVNKLLFPALGSLFFQRDFSLTQSVKQVVGEMFTLFKMDKNGIPLQNMQVRRYPLSVAECDEAGKQFVYNALPVQNLAKQIGPENLYFFAYDSFGNNEAITKELYQYIKDVSKAHGGSKVNLVPVSLGGTFFNALLDMYPDVTDYLHNVAMAIPALDGSRIVGDIFLRKLSSDNKNLYHDMIPLLVPGYTGDLINFALRLLPKKVVQGVFDAVLDSLIGDILSYSTTMWSLVPSGDYEAARAIWLADADHAEIRKQTDRYWNAQKNSRANIQALAAKGVNVYDIAEYDIPLYSIVQSYSSVNADGVIHLDSTSLGATSGKVGTPLPENYKAVHPVCINPEHNHLSPDGIVDASTCALPETTFFFKEAAHERTGHNTPLINLIILLVTAKDPVTVYDLADAGYVQFNQSHDKKVYVPADTTAKILDPLFAFLNDILYYCFGPRGYFDSLFAIWR